MKTHDTHPVFIILLTVALAAAISLGLIAYGEIDTLRYENEGYRLTLINTSEERDLLKLENAFLKESAQGDPEAYYRGAYAVCRTIAEGLFGVPAQESMPQCNDMVIQGKEFGLQTDKYWNSGYGK